jgi:hypothetical protein
MKTWLLRRTRLPDDWRSYQHRLDNSERLFRIPPRACIGLRASEIVDPSAFRWVASLVQCRAAIRSSTAACRHVHGGRNVARHDRRADIARRSRRDCLGSCRSPVRRALQVGLRRRGHVAPSHLPARQTSSVSWMLRMLPVSGSFSTWSRTTSDRQATTCAVFEDIFTDNATTGGATPSLRRRGIRAGHQFFATNVA